MLLWRESFRIPDKLNGNLRNRHMFLTLYQVRLQNWE